MNRELIIQFNKNNQRVMSVAMPFLIAFLCKLLYWSSSLNYVLNYYMVVVIKCILLGPLAMFCGGFIFLLFQMASNEPAVIINQKGIWIKYWGFIPWDNIEEVNTYIVPTTPMEAVGIRIKDLSSYSKQASFSGRHGIFWAKLFGYHYHISLSGLELENNQIVRFSRQFIR